MEELSGVIFTGCNEFMLFMHRSVRPTVVDLEDYEELTQGPGEVLDYIGTDTSKSCWILLLLYNAICAPPIAAEGRWIIWELCSTMLM